MPHPRKVNHTVLEASLFTRDWIRRRTKRTASPDRAALWDFICQTYDYLDEVDRVIIMETAYPVAVKRTLADHLGL